MSTEQNTIRWEQDTDGIVLLTLDDPSQSVNTMNAAYRSSMAEAVSKLESPDQPVTGVILTSAKKTFFAGGDLNDLYSTTRDDAGALTEFADNIKATLRRLETLDIPVVAALNGAALGGGLEIALACHHRIALDAPGVVFGLPEVTLGLLPGGGGIVRTVRLLGVQRALDTLLTTGKSYSAAAALDLGIVDETVTDLENLLARARQWIIAHPRSSARWDQPDYSMPGGSIALPGPSTGQLAASVATLVPVLRKRTRGGPIPALHNILCAAVEGAQVDFATASKIETRYFVELACGQVAKNMIKAFFFDAQAIKRGDGRPAGFERHHAHKVAVLGAGMMGAGIAYSCARSGMDVVLKDISDAAANRGKGHAVALCEKSVASGTMTRKFADELLDRITATSTAADVAGADLVIEAVFEDSALKVQVIAEVAPRLAPGAILSSNTSTIPISELAAGVDHPEDFIGLHFFSPVERMSLVEIIAGERTSDETLAKAVDIVAQLGKTPIVVGDSRGFYTSRVILNRLLEAASMLLDGVPPASIEQASTQAGYPVGTLALLDELTLGLPQKIRGQFKDAAEAAGNTYVRHPGEDVLEFMVSEHGRPGKAAGAGFYDYEDGLRQGFWPGLDQLPTSTAGLRYELRDLEDRLLFSEVLDTVRCFDENVLRSSADANIGSIYGIGFPSWTGGTAQFIAGYEGGVTGFVNRAKELAAIYGPRFEPPTSLIAAVDVDELQWA